MSELKMATLYVAGAYSITFVLAHLFLDSSITNLLALTIPSFFAYCQLFRIQCIAKTDFDDRAWHAERLRGLKAGSDWDGDGHVSDEERTKESAEWANAVLRGIWPIMNPDLYVLFPAFVGHADVLNIRFGSLIDMVEDIMQASVPKFIVSNKHSCE